MKKIALLVLAGAAMVLLPGNIALSYDRIVTFEMFTNTG